MSTRPRIRDMLTNSIATADKTLTVKQCRVVDQPCYWSVEPCAHCNTSWRATKDGMCIGCMIINSRPHTDTGTIKRRKVKRPRDGYSGPINNRQYDFSKTPEQNRLTE